MNNISNLFENLMMYNESANKDDVKFKGKKRKNKLEEEDTTRLNLSIELPNNVDDIDPNNTQVDVGIMHIDDEDEKDDEKLDEIDDEKVAEIDDEKIDEIDNEDKRDDEIKIDEDKNEEEDVNESVEPQNKRRFYRVECMKKPVKNKANKKESLLRMDNVSLSKLFTSFVKDNYKNIDKVVISKAILENKTLKLEGKIINESGETEKIVLVNKGFDASKLENKRFIMNFKDASETFAIVKECVNNAFIVTATLQEGILSFENLKYSFKSSLNESVNLKGNITL